MIIREIDLFKGIDPEVMNEIVDICSEETHKKNTILFKRGDEADRLYILEEGTVNLVVENGGTLVFSLTEPGEVFGWSSMVESGTYTASGVCVTDLKAIKIEREELEKIFSLHPELGLKVLKRLASVISQRLSNAYRDLLSARGQDTTPSYG
jgi:CRP-like cAMP-binding protein